ncbi:MAG: hypothetical protein QM758_30090 [Armatimonas sp.]
MKQSLLVAAILIGALAIASAPLPYRCTMTFLLEPVVSKPLGDPSSEPICQVFEDRSNYHFMTLCELLYSSEMQQKIHDPTATMEELSGTDVKLLLSEARTPQEAEESAQRIRQIYQELVGNFHTLDVKTASFLPWWRPVAALGLLALFLAVTRQSRRESL